MQIHRFGFRSHLTQTSTLPPDLPHSATCAGGEPKIFAPQKCVATSSFRNLCNEWIAQPAQRPQNQKNLGQPWIFRRTFRPRHTNQCGTQTSVRFAPPNAPTRFRFPVPVVEFLFQNILYELCSCGKCCEGVRVVVSTDDHKAIRIAPAIY
jgi:hypothetical protein